MKTIYHQLQTLRLTDGFLCVRSCINALPEYSHHVFVNDIYSSDTQQLAISALGVSIHYNYIITENDIFIKDREVRAIFYHCIGGDDQRNDYIVFREKLPGITLCAWIHYPDTDSKKYSFLNSRACSCLLFNSTYILHNTYSIDFSLFETVAIIHHPLEYKKTDFLPSIQMDRNLEYDTFQSSVTTINEASSAQRTAISSEEQHLTLPTNDRKPNSDHSDQVTLFLLKEEATMEMYAKTHLTLTAMVRGFIPIVSKNAEFSDIIIHGYNGFLYESSADKEKIRKMLHQDHKFCVKVKKNIRDFLQKSLSSDNLRRDLLRLIDHQDFKRLNLGCGYDILPGYLNFDTCLLPGVDKAAPIDPFYPQLPFMDEEFDEIIAYHVLEHVANKPMIIEEVWRIAKHNAVIKIKLPDYRHRCAFLDPTHLSYWNVDTIDFYLPGHQQGYYSPVKFGLLQKHTTAIEIYWELLVLRRYPDLRAEN